MSDNIRLWAAALGIFATGAFGGYYFTNQYHTEKEVKADIADKQNLICSVRVQKGHAGDVKSDYFVIEKSAKQEDCERLINYKNLPDDTESFWLGF